MAATWLHPCWHWLSILGQCKNLPPCKIIPPNAQMWWNSINLSQQILPYLRCPIPSIHRATWKYSNSNNGKGKKWKSYGDYTWCFTIHIISVTFPIIFWYQCESFWNSIDKTDEIANLFYFLTFKTHPTSRSESQNCVRVINICTAPSSSIPIQSSLKPRNLDPWLLWLLHFQEMFM